MRRAALSAIAVVVALVLQLTVIDRLPLPGGGPDLVLVVVVALGLTGGPMAGLLAGFGAGLALDIAPPASYLLGEHALVFCLVGYGCGRLSGITDRSAASSIGIAALAVAGGEVLQVIVGLLFGDPGVSWPAIQVVLPPVVLQDILISPFVVYLIMRASSWAARSPLRSAAGDTVPGLLAGPAGASRGSLVDGALLGGGGWLAWLPGSGRRKAGALASVRFSKYAARPRTTGAGSGPGSWRVVKGQIAGGRQRRLRPGAGQAGCRHRRPGPSPAAGQPGQHPDGIRPAGWRRAAGRSSQHSPGQYRPGQYRPPRGRPARCQPAQRRAARCRAARGRCREPPLPDQLPRQLRAARLRARRCRARQLPVAPGLAGAGPARAGGRRAGRPEPFPVQLPVGFPVEFPAGFRGGWCRASVALPAAPDPGRSGSAGSAFAGNQAWAARPRAGPWAGLVAARPLA